MSGVSDLPPPADASSAGVASADAALTEERDFLLASIDDLDREHAAGDLDDADYRALRDDYTARAAAVLSRLDDGRIEGSPNAADPAAAADAADSSSTRSTSVPRRPRGRRRTTVLVYSGVVAGASLIGLLVARSAGERVRGASVSGGVRAADGGRRARIDRLLQEATGFLNTQPVEAIKRYDEVLKLEPQNVQALAYRGWVLRIAAVSGGADDLFAQAEEYLDRAVDADPEDATARLFRGIHRFRDNGDAAAAVADLQYALDHDPPPAMRPQIASVLADAKAAVAEAAGTATDTTVVNDTAVINETTVGTAGPTTTAR